MKKNLNKKQWIKPEIQILNVANGIGKTSDAGYAAVYSS